MGPGFSSVHVLLSFLVLLFSFSLADAGHRVHHRAVHPQGNIQSSTSPQSCASTSSNDGSNVLLAARASAVHRISGNNRQAINNNNNNNAAAQSSIPARIVMGVSASSISASSSAGYASTTSAYVSSSSSSSSSSATAAASQTGFAYNSLLQNFERSSFFPINGYSSYGGTVKTRLELSQFCGSSQYADQYNLFLLALSRMQGMNQTAKGSFFSLAKVHGMPYGDWDGVISTGVPTAGYCAHSSNLFSVWHRPYLAAYELAIITQAAAIVEEIPKTSAARAKYATAIGNLRLPYLDVMRQLASNEPVLPACITVPTITVTYPQNGTSQTIPNPMYDFSFNPLRTEFPAPYSKYGRTLRAPTAVTGTTNLPTTNNMVSNNTKANLNLQTQRIHLRSLAYSILSQWQPYNLFACHGSATSTIGNLEGLHDSVHVAVGGQMGIINLAAFDPLFWFHHCNMDRIGAMFQALYPDTWITPDTVLRANYVFQVGQTIDSNTNLFPFHRSSALQFWTGESARQITSFGYTYPELADNPSNSSLIAKINAMYQDVSSTAVQMNSTSSSKQKREEDFLAGKIKHPKREYRKMDFLQGKIKGTKREAREDGFLQGKVKHPKRANRNPTTVSSTTPTYQSFILVIDGPRGLNGSFDTHFFLGPITMDTSDTWRLDPNYIGTISIFGKLFVPGTVNQDPATAPPVHATLPLNSGLATKIAQGKLVPKNDAAVLQYIYQNLKFRWDVPPGYDPNAMIPILKKLGFKAKIVSKNVVLSSSPGMFPDVSGDVDHGSVANGTTGANGN